MDLRAHAVVALTTRDDRLADRLARSVGAAGFPLRRQVRLERGDPPADLLLLDVSLGADDLAPLQRGAAGRLPALILLARADQAWQTADLLRRGARTYLLLDQTLEASLPGILATTLMQAVEERQTRERIVRMERAAAEQAALVREGTARWARTAAALEREKEVRSRTEMRLAQEEALLRSLIDLLPDPLYVKDAGSRFLVANRAVAELMGANGPDELTGRSDADFYPPEVAAGFRNEELRLLNGSLPRIEVEERVVDATGRERWLHTTKVPLPEGKDGIVGIVGIGRDITDRHRMEHDLRQANQQLEIRVRERTDCLHRADAANQRFLSALGQSIHRRLQGIARAMEALLGSGLAEQPRRRAAEARAWAGSLLALVEGILEVRGDRPANAGLAPFDLRRILADTVAISAANHGAQATATTLRLPSALPPLLGEGGRVRLAALLLLEEAMHDPGPGGIVLAAECQPRGDGTALVRVVVQGGGPHCARHGAVLGDPDLTVPADGDGLGLVVCRRLVEILGGGTEARSDGRSGTELSFLLVLPVASTGAAWDPA